MSVKDPICGMELTENEAHSRIVFKGKEFYFCSAACDETFRKINGLEVEGGEKPGDIERKMVAYNVLKQLAVTVAHYIRNANTAIRIQSQLCGASGGIIREQSDKIEAVVNSLLSLSDIRLKKYVESEEEAILDLRDSLEGMLNK